MANSSSQMRQLVDWSAAIWAGVVAGVVSFIMLVFVTPLLVGGGNAWFVIRYLASIVLGSSILPPPSTANFGALIVALVVHFVLSILFSLLLAYLIHRWGLLVGIVGGALFGAAIYGINFYSLTLIYPWFFIMRSWPVFFTHLIFGAVAGGVYESLEVEEFEPVEGVSS